jgi:CDP-paratose 2-epimerase
VGKGLDIVGIDNDMRSQFFGPDASTARSRKTLEAGVRSYRHNDIDIRDQQSVVKLFARYRGSVRAIVHTAAQPSHDCAAKAPLVDFSVDAAGTLNLLEATRLNCPDAAFIFTSTKRFTATSPTGYL